MARLAHVVSAFSFLALAFATPALAAAGDAVAINDAALRGCIETALDKSAGETITEGDLAGLSELRCSAKSVADLAGLEHASNLVYLEINVHAVSDLSPLAGLTSLRRLMASSGAIADVSPLANLTRLMELRIAANSISDVTPLAGLTALRTLDVGKNAITDISALAGLTSLTYLGIYYNVISDISAIKGMTGLQRLSMYRNAVADIGAVSGLTSLVDLNAENNDIWDISALTANAGLGSATSMYLAKNPLGCAAVSAVAELEARGVSVSVDAAGAAPGAPANLAAEMARGTATLTWDAPRAGTVRVHEVRHRAGADGVFGNWEMVPGGAESHSHSVSDLADGSHAFEVRAVNSAGCGEAARISTASAASPTVSIPDSRLHQCVEEALGKTPGEPTTEAEMATLTNLRCPVARDDQYRVVDYVASLAGLEHATSLVYLRITNHEVLDLSPLSGLASLRRLDAGIGAIADVSPLANLTGLTKLVIPDNNISDVTPLAGLTSLRYLDVGQNAVSDISALAGLTSLTFLGIYSNAISDISVIAGMTRLESLSFSSNAVADIDALSGLTSLVELNAEYNNIWDISALTANRGIGSATNMTLAQNPLGCAAVSAVAELRARGVRIYVGPADEAPSTPANLAVELARSTATLTWDAPRADTVRVHEVRRRSGANGDFGDWEMVPGGGESRSHRVSDLAGGNHVFEVRAVNAAGCSTAASASIGGATVSIRDAALRYCIERELDKDIGSAITEDDMASIERLSCRLRGPDRSPHGAIRSLEGLRFATGLRSLNIEGNAVSDLSPIAKLPLTTLDIEGNAVSDLSPIAKLPLETLDIYYNAVTDFSALTSLRSLTTLGAGGNPTSDLAPLGGLTGLTTLSMIRSALVDISPLAGLTNLTALHLGGNAISDVSALAALTSLEQLGLSDNAISDISGLAGLKSLTFLGLSWNFIEDVSPLRDLTSLNDFRISNNRITDIRALVENVGLGKGDYIELNINPIPCGANAVQIQTLRSRGARVYADEGPLSRPLDLAGTPGDASATLAWRAPEGCVVGHYEYRHGTGEPLVFNAWTDIGGGTTHTVSGLTNGVLHAFEVRALGTTDGNWGDASRVNVMVGADPDAPVEIHDPRLSKALAERLSDGEQTQGADDDTERTITQADLATFTSLSLDDLGITKLNGLEYAINLRALWLHGNALDTLAPIGELTPLTTLWASDNNLTDISALAGLSALTELALDGNAISDISALSQLSSLTRLWLNDNAIADIAPLVTNTGLGSGEVRVDGSSDYIDLRGNPLGTVALDEHAPALRGRGAAVLVDDGSHSVPVFLAAGSPFGESFVRILSRDGKAGEVSIVAIDAAGRRFGPTMFTLGAGRTMRIDSDDLEQGNPAIGLASGVGVGQGDWRLELRSALPDMEVHAYTRTKTGLVASMNVLAPEAYARHSLLTFDRSGNTGRLRVINPTSKVARALIEGVDGGGNAALVVVEVPAGTARDFGAAELATGVGTGFVGGKLGQLAQGAGEWRLRVTSYDGVRVLGLMSSQAQLTNLSLMPPMADASKPQHLPLIPAAEWPAGRSGFLRFVNYSAEAGSVEIRAFDRNGGARDPVTLAIGAGSAVRLVPADLAEGSAAKGLPKGIGEGIWRLELRSSSDVYAGSYMRASGSAPLVAMHGFAPRLASGDSDVVFFSPASSELSGRLRLVNVGTASARVAITGTDDSGASPGGVVRVTIPAGATREFTASELETGKADGLSGELGDGSGQWRLRVASNGDIHIVSLVESSTGYVGNVSR